MRLRGTVLDTNIDWMLIDVQGVGYAVGVSLSLSVRYQLGDEVTIWTHEVIRDDAHQLFGFESRDALELFWKLIAVNGVGPKVAQKILGVSTPEEVRRNVMEGSVDFLTRIPGVGKKTAQKIVLELKGSLVMDEDATEQTSTNQELIDALMSLGYATQEARSMANGLPEGLVSMEEKLKAALTISL